MVLKQKKERGRKGIENVETPFSFSVGFPVKLIRFNGTWVRTPEAASGSQVFILLLILLSSLCPSGSRWGLLEPPWRLSLGVLREHPKPTGDVMAVHAEQGAEELSQHNGGCEKLLFMGNLF